MNTDDKNDLISLGNCGKPHGIKGGFSFSLENTVDSVLKKGTKVTLYPNKSSSSVKKEGQEFTILSIAFGNKTIVYLKGITDRNDTEAMLPFEIKVSRDIFPEIEDDDEFYINDLIGMKVLEQGSDKDLGKVVKYFDNGAQIILSVRGTTTFDVPFVDHFVPEVDIDLQTMWIVVPVVV